MHGSGACLVATQEVPGIVGVELDGIGGQPSTVDHAHYGVVVGVDLHIVLDEIEGIDAIADGVQAHMQDLVSHCAGTQQLVGGGRPDCDPMILRAHHEPGVVVVELDGDDEPAVGLVGAPLLLSQ